MDWERNSKDQHNRKMHPWQKPLPDCFNSLENFEPDRLLPRETGYFVRAQANGHIVVQPGGVDELAKWILSRYRNNEMECLNYCAHELHPKTADKAAVDWIFLLSTVNFSFWTNEDYKIQVTYKGETYTGFYAAAACINRALDSGIPVTDAKFMKNITVQHIFDIFQGSTEKGTLVWALHRQRAEVIAEAGSVLLEKFDGSFYNCLLKCDKSAVKLLAMIVENFASYRDYGVYDGQKISFLRKAQLLIAQIYYCFKGKNDLADFYDIDQLTMSADHRIPQVLAYFMVLEYSPGLKESLKTRHIFEINDDIVIELRAISIKAIEDVVKRIEELRESSDSDLPKICAIDVGTLLWHYRREHAETIEAHINYLRVRSVHY